MILEGKKERRKEKEINKERKEKIKIIKINSLSLHVRKIQSDFLVRFWGNQNELFINTLLYSTLED